MNKSKNPDQMRTHLDSKVLPTLDLRPFINGEFRDPDSRESLSVGDPYQMSQLAELPLPSANDADRAVEAAHRAFSSGRWSSAAAHTRAGCLYRLADLIDDSLEELSVLESSDTGRILSGVKGWEVPHAAKVYRYYAGYVDKVGGRMLPLTSTSRIEIRSEPAGVCALLIPWNFPFACIAWKMAPALAAGCTVVVKTPERTPLAAQYLARLVREAGFPPGVVNIISGRGDEVGSRLVAHPLVNQVSFTGSPDTATSIVRASATHFPRLTLELGGKSPNLIFPDADVVTAARSAVDAMFGVSGQNCCAGSRTIVHVTVVEEFIRLVLELTRHRKLGDPLDETTEQGPQVDIDHVKRIDSYVADAIGKGAECHFGGRQRAETLFYEPTILGSVTEDMRLAREEVFGPVGAVYTFESEQEAFQIAGDTAYGLAAGIWTSDRDRVERFIASAHVGTCWVNTYGEFDIRVPWGGSGLSGYGRELGEAGFQEFLRIRSVYW